MCNERAVSSSSSSDGAVTCSPGQQISWKAAFSLSGLETSASSDSNHARLGKTGNDPNAKARQCVVFVVFFLFFFLTGLRVAANSGLATFDSLGKLKC